MTPLPFLVRSRSLPKTAGPLKPGGHALTRAALRRTDQDQDGVVSKEELGAMMKKLGNEVTDVEIKDIITESGSSKASGITYAEFQKLMGMGIKNLREPEDPEDELRHAFRLFDQDGDGAWRPNPDP